MQKHIKYSIKYKTAGRCYNILVIFLPAIARFTALCRMPGQCELCVLLGLGLIGLVKRHAHMMS